VDEEDGATEITLEHVGFGAGPRWDRAFGEAQKAWTEALDNLKSVLEEGVDLRQLRRPLLGVMVEGMDAERARREGIAAEAGVYVTGLVEGGAAKGAGIRKGDVIVSLDGQPMESFTSLTEMLHSYRVGDTVEVGLMRGQEQLALQVTLKGMEPMEVPDDPAEAAARLRERHAQFNAALADAVAGLSEEQAEKRPEEGEWSVKEVLAHLSIVERDMQAYFAQIALGVPLEGEANPTVWPERLAAVLATEPTLQGLLDRFARDQEETALLIEHISETTRADRYRYRQIIEAAFWYGGHTEEHIAQIRATIEATRG